MSGTNGRAKRVADNTAELVSIVARRAAPSPQKPQFDPETEERLREVDRKSAECYADAELLALRLRRAVDAVEATEDGVPLAELDDTDSVVTSATHLQAVVAKPPAP